MSKPGFRRTGQNTILLFVTLFLCFFVTEIGYRLLDPFPYISGTDIERTEHGRLSTYDDTLGWKGVPWGEAELVTKSNRVWIAHNRNGFRDIEHNDPTDERPAIVFLGDSMTWGYEVEFEQMFVSLLRDVFPGYRLFNLAHRGYGTDQELLTFKRWPDMGRLALVVLMFCENDIADNNSTFRNRKAKPKYQVIDNQLVLVGVPVPETDEWKPASFAKSRSDSRWSLRRLLLRSHFIHDIDYRIGLSRGSNRSHEIHEGEDEEPDLTLTSRILEELDREVGRRGAKLVVVLIPSKAEIEELDDSPPYRIGLAGLCQDLGIEYLDLTPKFKDTWLRTYYRKGLHWNSRGHRVTAAALRDYLIRDLGL